MIKIVIIDDHQMIIDGLKLLASNFKNLEIVGQAKHLSELYSVLNRTQPDILILDIKIGEENGIDEVVRLRNFYPNMKIILFSSYNFPSLVKKALELKVDGYLLKDTEADELITAIETVMSNKKFIGGNVNRSTFRDDEADEFEDNDEFVKKFNLSSRELEIIRLIVQGLESGQISEELFITLNTVKTHRKNIFKKLNITSSTELIRFALENGLASYTKTTND
ncbi:MAG: response regulator transcription factor [Saprospiraceae bacterium]|nr:response regulator transcription factor [Saprospiraceae bacterium]